MEKFQWLLKIMGSGVRARYEHSCHWASCDLEIHTSLTLWLSSLQNGLANSPHLTVLLWGSNKMLPVSCLALCLTHCKHPINISSFCCLSVCPWARTMLFSEIWNQVSEHILRYQTGDLVTATKRIYLQLTGVPLSLGIARYANVDFEYISHQCPWPFSWLQLNNVRIDARSRVNQILFFLWSIWSWKWRHREMEGHWSWKSLMAKFWSDSPWSALGATLLEVWSLSKSFDSVSYDSVLVHFSHQDQ